MKDGLLRVETDRLVLTVSSLDEMNEFIKKQTDEVMIQAYNEMLGGSINHPDQWEWYAIWMITLKDGTYIGDLCFKGLNDNGTVEIGYGLSEEYWGCGYATEAVGAAVQWALSRPGVAMVEAETEPDNARSRRVLEKCGFYPNGVMGEEGPRFERKNKWLFT